MSDALMQNCDACGVAGPAADFKQASMPSTIALGAVDDGLTFDEPPLLCSPPPKDLIDRQLYCPACRWRVNLKRGLWLAFYAAAILTLGRFAMDLL